MIGTCMQGPTRVDVMGAVEAAMRDNPGLVIGSLGAAGATIGLDNAAFLNGYDRADSLVAAQTIALTNADIGVNVGVSSGLDFGR